MAVICSSVQEITIALLVILLMPLNGCICISILATLLKKNPISPPLVLRYTTESVSDHTNIRIPGMIEDVLPATGSLEDLIEIF